MPCNVEGVDQSAALLTLTQHSAASLTLPSVTLLNRTSMSEDSVD